MPPTSTRPSVMIKFLIKLVYYQLFFCFFLCGICLSAQPIAADGNISADTSPFKSLSKPTQQTRSEDIQSISSQTFSFDDVFRLELNLDIPGNVRIVAIDSEVKDKDTITVMLEKRVLQNNPLFSKSFLENITLTGIKKEGTLRLNSQLPDDVLKAELKNKNAPDIKSHLHLSYTIKTPPDVSVELKVKAGDVYLHHLRGKIKITNEMGKVHLDETLGNYDVEVKQGKIHGRILLAPGQSKIKTLNGPIDLTVLDDLAAPLDLTALGDGIGLFLPENYAADVELKNEKEHYIINLPAEIDNNVGVINGGGPLLRLTATDAISVRPNPRLRSTAKDSESSASEETISTELVQPIPLTTQSPMIDGNLSEKAWLNAVALSAFQNPIGTETAENPTDVYLMWDAKYLYIGVRAHIQNMQIPRVSQTQQDSPIWEDESIEILLDMNPETEAYSHLIINPIGGLFDQWVTKVGFPNFRFAPSGVPREPIDDSVEQFKGDSSWNSSAKVATQIKANFWSLEVAILRKYEKEREIDTWLFNIHRKLQVKQENGEDVNPTLHREYSYWSPVYDEEYPWWPHWKEGMGRLKLVKPEPSTSKTFEVSESLEVNAVEVEGNTTIPTDVILKHVPITSGDTITNEQLAWLIAELENFDWFQKVELKTVILETDKPKPLDKPEPLKVNVQINVTEAPVKYARRVTIYGNKSFPSQFIQDWFDISSGYLADNNVNLKHRMMTDFYKNRGFPFAEVKHAFINEMLQYNINEGSLDEIRFTGNRRISQTELTSALEIDTKEVFFHALGQSKINKLHQKLSETNEDFKSIKGWQVQREGGRNILIVDIQEQPLVKPGWSPILGFNHVHGLVLGAGGSLSTDFTGDEQLFGSVSRGFSSKIWNYHFGIEKSFFKRYPLTTGVGFFKLTDISSHDYRLLPAEADLSAAVYGTALQNYFQREGEQIWIAQRYGESTLMRLEFTQEDHDNLSKSTDWSYFDRKRIKRDNPRIDTGFLNMLSLSYTFDTRDHKSTIERPQNLGSVLLPWPNERTRRGWRGHLGFEIAGGNLGGDYTFNFFKFELVRYTPIFGPHHINIRLSGAFSDAALPRQHLLYLGGATTLRGYGFNTYAGDKRILCNIEYRLFQETRFNNAADAIFGWALSSFLDTGRVWWHDENPFSEFSLNQLKTSIGVGLSFFVSPPGDIQPFSTAVEIAVPLIDVESPLRSPRIIWRLERMF